MKEMNHALGERLADNLDRRIGELVHTPYFSVSEKHGARLALQIFIEELRASAGKRPNTLMSRRENND